MEVVGFPCSVSPDRDELYASHPTCLESIPDWRVLEEKKADQ